MSHTGERLSLLEDLLFSEGTFLLFVLPFLVFLFFLVFVHLYIQQRRAEMTFPQPNIFNQGWVNNRMIVLYKKNRLL